MEDICRHTVEAAAHAAADCLVRMSQLMDRQEISAGDVIVARRRLASARQHAHHLLYQVARQHEDAARVHLRAEQVHLRAIRLALGDPDAHSDAATRHRLGATHHFSVAARRRQQATAGRAPYSPADDEEPVGQPAPLQRVVTFMEEHAAEPVTIADVSAAVHLTPRAVQFMFRRHFDCTPTAYLRRIRMQRVDRDLRATDPGFDTVTNIAARWGFAHTGRFARDYKQLYGRSPSETLRTPSAETAGAAR